VRCPFDTPKSGRGLGPISYLKLRICIHGPQSSPSGQCGPFANWLEPIRPTTTHLAADHWIIFGTIQHWSSNNQSPSTLVGMATSIVGQAKIGHKSGPSADWVRSRCCGIRSGPNFRRLVGRVGSGPIFPSAFIFCILADAIFQSKWWLFCVFTRDSIYAKRVYAMAIPSVCPSVCLSVCHTGGSVKNGWS